MASGKLDGFREKNLNLWDICSGVLLVQEAGGRISNMNGENWTVDSKNIIASNTKIHNILSEKLSLL